VATEPRPCDNRRMKPSAADADDLTRDSDELLAELLDQLMAEARAGGRPQIERVAAGHPELHDELRQLWATARVAEDLASASGAVDNPSAPSQLPSSPALGGLLPRTIGDYELLEVIGRGG